MTSRATAAGGGDGPAAAAAAKPGDGEDAALTIELVKQKDRFVAPTVEERKVLSELLKAQLVECNFETFYDVGRGDEGTPDGLTKEQLDKSLATLKELAAELNAEVFPLRTKSGKEGDVAEVLVRTCPTGDDFQDIRVAVCGNVDAGKSTLLGVLTHGELDNGRGKSRQRLFRHAHEAESGRTSSVSHDILGFSTKGEVVNKPGHDGKLDWAQICHDSAKVLTFIDLAGHERYLKTTVFGLTGHMPEFVMLMIGSNAGIIGMTKEHLGLTLALGKPVFVVITKIDMCPPNVLAATLKLLQKILKSAGCRKIPLLVNNEDDVIDASKNFLGQRLCPIFQVSNVTGENLDLLRSFMNLLRPAKPANTEAPAVFQIDETFSVPGVGTVVSGTTVCGTITAADTMLLGPDSVGNFQQVAFKGIHRRRMPVKEVRGGQAASFALKKVKRAAIRKGMVLVHPAVKPVAHWEFDAEVVILHHPTTITTKYQAMVHVGSVRQTAAILEISGLDRMRTGDKAKCRFRFVRFPEFLEEGTRVVFREGRTKAVGTILRLVPPEEEMARGLTLSRVRAHAAADRIQQGAAAAAPAATPSVKAKA
mmetsp:Transcript_25979/g.68168  ORF Transcript_25979/g.68168 Transcript_25979/m.68168 type:complete len:592 (-) Transcript_25979:78-1853(-)